MAWWWPFKRKGQAAQAEKDFREMLDQAMLRKGDLEDATEKLREIRKHEQKNEAPKVAGPPPGPPRPRTRNA